MGITDDLAKPIRQLQRSIELSVVDPRNQALISYPLSTLSVIKGCGQNPGLKPGERHYVFIQRST